MIPLLPAKVKKPGGQEMGMALHKEWHEALKEELKKDYVKKLKEFVATERKQAYPIYPPEREVFQAFYLTPLSKVRVVIVGQDPYHGPGQAEGLCFSVKKGVAIPPSLRNMFKEISQDTGEKIPEHGSLRSWAEQGVFLLNATLTVRHKEPKSHYGRGWETFTDNVIKVLSLREKPLIFLLWGASAQKKQKEILENSRGQHKVLTAAHPSPLSATKFLGCRHFSKTNSLLEEWGDTPINWGF